jgi:excisionase family DNA binding protein
MGTHRADERSSELEHRGSAMPRGDRAGGRVHSPARESATQERLVLCVSQAAVLLGISRAFAYELVARDELPVIRLGRRRLVPKRALLALVDEDPSGVTDDLEG